MKEIKLDILIPLLISILGIGIQVLTKNIIKNTIGIILTIIGGGGLLFIALHNLLSIGTQISCIIMAIGFFLGVIIYLFFMNNRYKIFSRHSTTLEEVEYGFNLSGKRSELEQELIQTESMGPTNIVDKIFKEERIKKLKSDIKSIDKEFKKKGILSPDKVIKKYGWK